MDKVLYHTGMRSEQRARLTAIAAALEDTARQYWLSARDTDYRLAADARSALTRATAATTTEEQLKEIRYASSALSCITCSVSPIMTICQVWDIFHAIRNQQRRQRPDTSPMV